MLARTVVFRKRKCGLKRPEPGRVSVKFKSAFYFIFGDEIRGHDHRCSIFGMNQMTYAHAFRDRDCVPHAAIIEIR